MSIRQQLIETFVHLPPARMLEDLTSADAERRLPGVTHSIAEILAHVSFWQDWFCARCSGVADPMVRSAARGWPAVSPGSWPEIRARFLEGLDRAVALEARAAEPITPAIEFPPLAGYTVGNALAHIAQHNSHHLGEVVIIRQVAGLWPPPSGSWTW